ncbi:AraC family transcriptional regulator [Gymnodinialimonas sp. 57CJ19]|uniref:AraC family transcriptional regulator n=1 Tax=Gymnodinialimonas sp. 57CJ19 TaxID=3138498 RepID=UPI0031342782
MQLDRLKPFKTQSFQTNDPSEARSVLNEKFKPHVMRRLDSDPFDFAHMSAQVPGGTFNILKYGGAVEITPDPFEDFFMLEMPLASGVNIESTGRPSISSDKNTALLLPPHVKFSSTWRPQCLQLMLKVESVEVLRRWQTLTGDPEAQLPRGAPEVDLRTSEGWRVQQLMRLLQQEFELAVTSKVDRLSQSPLSTAVVDAVLCYYRYSQGNLLIGGSHRILPAQLRQCVAYIECNIAGDLSMPQLLAQTNYSERTLFNQFNQFLDLTPKGYVQQQRLRNSRRMLLSGNVTVADAAKQSGFTHMGRFSSLYRKRYGENPSQT